MIIESLLNKIKLGREGKNHGFSMGMPKLESIIDGVTKQTYSVIFSNSGTGKSSFVLYSYIYRPLMEHLEDNDYRIFYFSLEMNADMIFAKLLSTYIFETYGLQLSMKELLSRKKDYILDDDSYKIVQECIPWLQKIESKITIYDKALNAKVLYKLLMDDLSKIGSFTETEHRKTYIPNNPNLIYSVIIDHISLVRPSEGNTLKMEMDNTSKYLLTLRNICGISPIVVQQANREQGSMDRRKNQMSNFTLNDTKDSGGPVQDAEVVISIYNPNRDRLNSYHDYDLTILGNNLRIITVLKDRYGDSDIEIASNFFGGINRWEELPLAKDIYDQTKYGDPAYLLKKDKKEIIEDEKKINLNYKL
jgi:replicative DNA helicase